MDFKQTLIKFTLFLCVFYDQQGENCLPPLSPWRTRDKNTRLPAAHYPFLRHTSCCQVPITDSYRTNNLFYPSSQILLFCLL